MANYNISSIVGDDVMRIAENMREKIIARHVADGQRTTGKTSAMLRVEPTATGFVLHGWEFSGTYQEGRAPGKQPPTEDLLLWAQAKGIQFADERKARNWAYCVARKIASEGTQRYRKNVDIFDTPIKEMRDELAEKLLMSTAEQVTRILLRIDTNTK